MKKTLDSVKSICDVGKGESCLGELKVNKVKEFWMYFAWSRILAGLTLFLIYAVLIARIGVFNWLSVAVGFLIIFIALGTFSAISKLFKKFFTAFDFLKLFLFSIWILWMILLLVFFSNTGFEGRDEGSYSNMAMYLVENGNLVFEHEMLPYLKNEGPAHQALNYPGFLIAEDKLTTQFSPAYSVYLAVFYLFLGSTIGWWLANSLLILAGIVSFYLLLRLFLPRWVVIGSTSLLLFNFNFLWFPRFTLSENLAFPLFTSLLLLISLIYFTSEKLDKKNIEKFIHKHRFIVPALLLICILFPLTRPEGWWILIAVLGLLAFRLRKVILSGGYWVLGKIILFFTLGSSFLTYILWYQFPVYKRLIKDFIEWSENKEQYLTDSLNVWEKTESLLLTLVPKVDKLTYFWKVELIYGVLFFGVTAILFFWMVLIVRIRKSVVFPRQMIVFGRIVFFLSIPFFIAFVSPQISSDHPWMLRRFMFAVIPIGVMGAVVILTYFASKIKKHSFVIVALGLALMFIPSISASSYFLTIRTNDERAEVLDKIGSGFTEDDWIFMHRLSSGDGWHMFSAPLSSKYGISSAYVFSPQNVINAKDEIYSRWANGKRTYIILPNKAYDFEHTLKSQFTLLLEKEIDFTNYELEVEKDRKNVNYPLLKKHIYSSKIYLLKPL